MEKGGILSSLKLSSSIKPRIIRTIAKSKIREKNHKKTRKILNSLSQINWLCTSMFSHIKLGASIMGMQ